MMDGTLIPWASYKIQDKCHESANIEYREATKSDSIKLSVFGCFHLCCPVFVVGHQLKVELGLWRNQRNPVLQRLFLLHFNLEPTCRVDIGTLSTEAIFGGRSVNTCKFPNRAKKISKYAFSLTIVFKRCSKFELQMLIQRKNSRQNKSNFKVETTSWCSKPGPRNTHIRLQPPQEKRLHYPFSMGYPIFLIVGSLTLILHWWW